MAGRSRVLATGNDLDQAALGQLPSEKFDVEQESRTLSRSDLISRLRGFEYYIYGGIEAADELEFEDFRELHASGLRLIAFAGKGVGDFLQVKAATSAGIMVTNTPGAVEPSVAEFTVYSSLLILRSALKRELAWLRTSGVLNIAEFPPPSLGGDLSGVKFGIIGMGDIGTIVAKILRLGFGTDVSYYSRKRKPAIEAELGVSYKSADAILSESNIVSIHLPVSDSSIEFVGALPFEELLSPVGLVNTSSQKLFPAQRLASLLQSGAVSAAVFDKFYPVEETRAAGLLAYTPDRLIVTNHTANTTKDAWLRMTESAVLSVIDAAGGRAPKHAVG